MDDKNLGVQFDIDELLSSDSGGKNTGNKNTSGLAGLLIRWEIARNETTASWILVLFSLMLLAISGWVLYNEFSSSIIPPSQEEIQRIQEITPSS